MDHFHLSAVMSILYLLKEFSEILPQETSLLLQAKPDSPTIEMVFPAALMGWIVVCLVAIWRPVSGMSLLYGLLYHHFPMSMHRLGSGLLVMGGSALVTEMILSKTVRLDHWYHYGIALMVVHMHQ